MTTLRVLRTYYLYIFLAQLNGDPIYLMSGENHNDNEDVREALDVILPQENVHSHVDRQNGQESVYEEPLQESAYEDPLLSESESDYDYPQSNRKYFKK